MTTFPGLTAAGVRKHLPKSIQTTMGHMRKVRQNIRSTKDFTVEEIMDEDKDIKDPQFPERTEYYSQPFLSVPY